MLVYLLYKASLAGRESDKTEVMPPVSGNPYTTEQMARMRKQSEDEIKAFQELMNYNADVAYGIKRGEDNE